MRAFFGLVSKWPKETLLVWGSITVLIFPLALFAALRVIISRNFLEKAIQVGIVPCILLVYYAIPSEFTILNIENHQDNGNRPPVHLIIFDSLSYEFLLNDSSVSANYPKFESFSHESDVFTNAYSPSSSTDETIPRLLTRIDLWR